ncbi:hypothetical protein EVAR_22782_1 [Eumeta japonica]|uniref:Uncharacterized protein n=1 Tax=Eumeta variegata TaxID=151549 RepID=A0A4C1USX0_EUMVA|nr:hypothetical protein EVAR_22782_1 [Eumeta japonica]
MRNVNRSKAAHLQESRSDTSGYKREAVVCRQEFAETAMNELLGWYGYEGLELRRWAARRAAPPPRRASRSDDKGNRQSVKLGRPFVDYFYSVSSNRNERPSLRSLQLRMFLRIVTVLPVPLPGRTA